MVARYAAVGFLLHAATGQVLLHHRDANTAFYPETWAAFGGSNEPEDGGDPAVTWRREMREELGITLAPDQIRFLRTYVNPRYQRRRYIFYAAWPSVDDHFALNEGDGYAWYSLDAAITLPDLMDLARGDLILLRDAVARAPVVRHTAAPAPAPESTERRESPAGDVCQGR